MKNKIKLLLILISATLLSESAFAYSLNTYYSALGSIRLFDNNKVASSNPLLDGSYIQFASDGSFNYYFITNKGKLSGKQTFDVAKFLQGTGNLQLLTPNTGTNLGNNYVGHGVFTPDLGVTNFTPFTHIASAMSNAFRLDSNNGSFTIWNAQYSSAGVKLGNTDFWLTTGGETTVPEPMSVSLLLGGIAGIICRRKKHA